MWFWSEMIRHHHHHHYHHYVY